MWKLKLHSQALLNSKILFSCNYFWSWSDLNLRLAFQFFGLETRITSPINFKICAKVVPYARHLRSKFQVFTFSRFEVAAILASGCKKKNLIWHKKKKKQRDFRRKASEGPHTTVFKKTQIFVFCEIGILWSSLRIKFLFQRFSFFLNICK